MVGAFLFIGTYFCAMQIGVNATCLYRETPAGTGNIIKKFLWELCNRHPEQSFVFFFDQEPAVNALPANARAVVIPRGSGSRLQQYLWQEWKLPKAIRKEKAALFIGLDGTLPKRSRIRKQVVLTELDVDNHMKYVAQAERVIVFSKVMEEAVLRRAPYVSSRLNVVQPGIPVAYRPLEWEERVAVKEEFSGGVEYFVALGDLHPQNNILPLLKAFSALKRRLHSNMKLVLAGQSTPGGAEITAALASYKFRNDVVLLPDLDQATLARLVGGAYALVYTNRLTGYAAPVYAALRCEVPVVAMESVAAREAGGEAVLYTNPDDLSDLAEKMSLVYKDEQLRSQLIQKGNERILPMEVDIPALGY